MGRLTGASQTRTKPDLTFRGLRTVLDLVFGQYGILRLGKIWERSVVAGLSELSRTESASPEVFVSDPVGLPGLPPMSSSTQAPRRVPPRAPGNVGCGRSGERPRCLRPKAALNQTNPIEPIEIK